MSRSVHDDFERIQEPNLRAANEHLHRRVTELEEENARLKRSLGYFLGELDLDQSEISFLEKELNG